MMRPTSATLANNTIQNSLPDIKEGLSLREKRNNKILLTHAGIHKAADAVAQGPSIQKKRERSLEKKLEPKFDTSLGNIPIQTLNSSYAIAKEHENYLAKKTGFGENSIQKDTARVNNKLIDHLATLKRIIDE